jgi:hypothetical protein
MTDYTIVLGYTTPKQDKSEVLHTRIVDVSNCQNFIQAVEIGTLCIQDSGGFERIVSVAEADYDDDQL